MGRVEREDGAGEVERMDCEPVVRKLEGTSEMSLVGDSLFKEVERASVNPSCMEAWTE